MAELEAGDDSGSSSSKQATDSIDNRYDVSTWEYKSAVSDYISGDGIQLTDEVDTDDAKQIYERDLLAHREVKKENEDIFRHPPKIKSDSEQLEERIKDLLFGKLSLWTKLHSAFLGAQLDSTALVYFNYTDSNEIDEAPENITDINQIGVIYRNFIKDYAWEDDIEKENFGEIKAWKYRAATKTSEYDRTRGNDNKSSIERWIHTDRVMQVKYDDYKNDPYGISKIEPAFNYHIYRQSVVESMVMSYYLNASGIKMFQPPEDATPQEIEWLKKNIKSMREKAELVAPHGTTVEHPAPQTTDPTPYLDHLMEAGFSMPYQILAGVQAGQVTGSETNLRLYYREVQNTRVNTLGPLLNSHFEMLQEKGYLPDGEFELEWGDIFELDEEARSNVLLRRARATADLFELGLLNQEEARKLSGLEEEFGGDTVMLDEDEEEETDEEEQVYGDYREFGYDAQQEDEVEKMWDEMPDEDRKKLLAELDVYNPNRDIERRVGEAHIWLSDFTDKFLERVREIIDESGSKTEMISRITDIGAMDYGQFRNVLAGVYRDGYVNSYNSVSNRNSLLDEEEDSDLESVADDDDFEQLESEKDLMSNRVERRVRSNYEYSAVEVLRDEETDNEFGAVKQGVQSQMDTESNRMNTLISTELMMAVGMGLAYAYRRAGQRKVIWIALMDEVTCNECMRLDGTVMTVQRARSMLPVHPGGRCSFISEDEYDRAVQRL